MLECRTISVSIQRPPDEVYAYLSDPAVFPQWSDFIREMKRDGPDWIATTANGTSRLRFVARNPFRILDHMVFVSPEIKVHVPMRVVSNGDDGSEVLFTVFRLPEMNDVQFEEDVRLVLTDLRQLKRVLETKSSPGRGTA